MSIRKSLYWDNFETRIDETVKCIKQNQQVPVRRVAVFITNACNFRCKYCNVNFNSQTLSQQRFEEILDKYGKTAIIHITGGEPSVVKWLYPFLEANGDKYSFHLNTNAYRKPPSKSVKRLKVSLDSCDPEYWNQLVGRNAFETVVNNIKQAIPDTIVSITFTLNRQNYKQSVEFARFVKKEFPGLYAVFFSVYKGNNLSFSWDKNIADDFFNNVMPDLEKQLGDESLALIKETIDEKKRLIQGVRFPENDCGTCYLSMSERVISPSGQEFYCSHLYRDNVFQDNFNKHKKCLYGCNRRLVMFNEKVQEMLE